MPAVIDRNATPVAIKSDTTPVVQQPRLLDRVRNRIRVLHYSRSTEKTYLHWIVAFIRFHKMRHPQDMGAPEIEAYLSHLATARDVAKPAFQQTITGGCAAFHCFRSTICASIIYLDVFELVKRGDFPTVEK